MNELMERRERHLGWVLAGAMTIHLLVLVARGPVLLAALGMMMFPIFTVYVTSLIQKKNKEKEEYYKQLEAADESKPK